MASKWNEPPDDPPRRGGRVLEVNPPPQGTILGVLIGIGLILLLLLAFTSAYTVQQDEQAIVLRFGKIVRTTDPGLHFKLPFGIETVERVAVTTVRKAEFGFITQGRDETGRASYGDTEVQDESLMLTGDLNVIDVEWVVQYKISEPEKYLFRGLREPEETLEAISESVMRRIVGNRLGSNVLTEGRTDIAERVQDEMQDILDSYNSGITIVRVELQDVLPPEEVKDSFNKVNESRQERERMINEAERYRNEVLPRAQGQARGIIDQAEGYTVERVNRARGEAARFLAILEEYQGAPEVTRQRLYLEMMDRVLPQVRQLYIMDGSAQQAPLPVLDLQNEAAAVRAVAPASALQPAAVRR